MTRLAVAAILGFALALTSVSFAAAQGGADVQISQLDCTGDPEIVVVTNSGDAAQNLTGWELRSDPEASEVFDLSVLGSLLAGGSVSIQSGPSSSGIFGWGTDEVYRDNDATDYARIVDDSGATVHQVDCPGVAAQSTPTPTPTPTPQPVGEIPNGGGAPPLTSGASSPAMILLVGGSLAVAGVALIALPRLRLRLSPVAVAASSPQRDYRYRGGSVARQGRSSTAFGLTLVGLYAVAMFLILRRRA